MKYEFHPAALQEYAEAVQFFAQYNRHQDFIDTIENAIFRIVESPDSSLLNPQVFLRNLISSLFRANRDCGGYELSSQSRIRERPFKDVKEKLFELYTRMTTS